MKKQLFENLINDALTYAKKLGASDAVASVSENQGMAIGIRKQQVETIERTHDTSMGILVYNGQQKGSASTSSFSLESIKDTVRAAWDIARYTSPDPKSGLPDASDLQTEFRDLDLYHPWDITPEQAIQKALHVESGVLELAIDQVRPESADVNTQTGRFVLGNTLGFMAGYPYSSHSLSVEVIAQRGQEMHRDYWYASKRNPQQLPNAQKIGRYAAQRALSRLGAKPIPTGRYPILLEAPLAVGLIGNLCQAISGGALYRKASFLVDQLGQPIMSSHITIHDDPFIKGAYGSGMFDNEGVKTQKRDLVTQGVLQGYLLSSYTARQLGMKTTGNAGGSHGVSLRSSQTQAGDDFEAMLKKMDRGFLVTELMGRGINYLTGDYSRGAFGYWVENGQIQHAVQEVTIAGNLKDMFKNIVAVGADTITRGNKTTGSILLEGMTVAGK